MWTQCLVYNISLVVHLELWPAMSWLEFPFRLSALSHKNICTLSKIINAPQPYANDLFLCFENATYITSVQFWNFGDISVAVSIALPSPSPFVTQTQIPRLLKIYYPETNLLPENHRKKATFLYIQRERKFYVEIFWWSTPKEAPQMNYEPFPGTQHNMNPRGFTGFRNTYELYGHFNSWK